MSQQGQVEPLQNLLTLLAISFTRVDLFRRPAGRVAALGLLGLAIQVKLFPVLLLPWFLWRLREPGARWGPLAALLVSFAPTLWAMTRYPVLQQVLFAAQIRDISIYSWRMIVNPAARPGLQVAFWATQAAVYLGTLLSVVGAIRTRRWLDFLAPAAFLAALRFLSASRAWYMLLLPPFVMPLGEGPPEDDQARRAQVYRLALLLLWPLMDLSWALGLPAAPRNPFLEPFFPMVLPPEFMKSLLGGS